MKSDKPAANEIAKPEAAYTIQPIVIKQRDKNKISKKSPKNE